ncbi:MAG: glycosyltransferase involved in cell wall biosynthesis [Patiriisocius sp.]|jgi:glycosyltransferase involved in cell wall biosynthesis
MPKILRILNRYNIGGPIYNAANLCKYQAPEFESLLMGGENEPSEKDSLKILDDLNVKYVIVPHMGRKLNLINDFKAYKHISNVIKEYKPDIVHTHASKAGALGRLAASKYKVKAIVHTFHGHVFHSYFSKLKSKLYVLIERYLAKKSSKIIAISEIQKEELAEVYKIADKNKFEVIPLGFDLDKFFENQEIKRAQFRSTYGLDDETLAIGIVGRIVPIKNHSLFLTSLKYLQDHTEKKWKAFIIGDGESRNEIEKMARELNICFSSDPKNNSDSLHFTSFLTEMDEVMAGLDIITLTSKNEGTPVSLIEAQAARKPIVSTLVGGVADVVLEGSSALCSKVHDKDLFHENLLKVVEDNSLRESLGNAGVGYVKKKYHYTRLVSDMNRLYNQLLQ